MSLTWDQAKDMIKDTDLTIVDMNAEVDFMASLIAGKLQYGGVSAYNLCKLK
jgi:hypothetical protein